MSVVGNLVFMVLVVGMWKEGEGHGRLLDPPARSSRWRFGFPSPDHNYNDQGNNCGGMSYQWEQHNGKCGYCGDAYGADPPRDLEHGGKYGDGTITRVYYKGDNIDIRVELTQQHKGWFEFRICNLDKNEYESDECLDENLLTLLNGMTATRFEAGTVNTNLTIRAVLPSDLTCRHCSLQWKYNTGNSWGTDETGKGGLGLGAQEQFYGCADIQILNEGEVPSITTPIPPTTVTTTRKPVEHFCHYVGDVDVFDKVLKFFGGAVGGEVHDGDDLLPYLDELCQCFCSLETGACSHKLCECGIPEHKDGGCKSYTAVGSYARAFLSDDYCDTECKKGIEFCPADKCTCSAFISGVLKQYGSGTRMAPFAPVSLVLLALAAWLIL